jgi:sugar-specific transcriptional regulator TrmB
VTDPTTGGAGTDVDTDAVRTLLTDLGLSTYEAGVFVALQRLGVATASEIEAISNVPQSQVYGAAEGLAERGLIHTQQTTPRRYRPVDLDVAREQLWCPFERRLERSFETLEALATRPDTAADAREDVWIISGMLATDARVEELISAADCSVVLGVGHPTLVTDSLVDAIAESVDDGVDVRILSRDAAVIDRFESTDAPLSYLPSDDGRRGVVGRVLVVDDDAVLVSAYDGSETAIWTTSTGVASLLVGIIKSAVDGVPS